MSNTDWLKIALVAAPVAFVVSFVPKLLAPGAKAPAELPKEKVEKIVHDYLLAHPEILADMTERFRAAQRKKQEEQAKAALAAHGDLLFANPQDPVAGNPKGARVLVEFFDYNCGFCRRALKDVQRLVKENADLKVVFKEFPILGPGSDEAARIALAAKLQDNAKYWRLHQALLGFPGRVDGKVALAIAERLGLDVERLKKDMESDQVKSIIATNMQLADALGIQGTPAFVTRNRIIRGALGYAALKRALQTASKDGNGAGKG